MQEAAIQAFIIGLNYPPALVQNNVPQWVKQERWRQESGRRLKSIKGLNESQRLAIAYSQKQLLTLWQGPPGEVSNFSMGCRAVIVNMFRCSVYYKRLPQGNLPKMLSHCCTT